MREIDTKSNGGPHANKCVVTVRTVEKWIVENDKVLSMAKWLSSNKVHQEYVALLICFVCKCFKDKLHNSRIFNPAFIVSWTNLRASTFKDCDSQTYISKVTTL